MCYRFYMELSPELKPIVEAANRSSLGKRMVSKLGRPLTTNGEVRPTNIVPVLAPDKSGARVVFPMVWGFQVKGLSSPLVNARSETASQKPTFREAWASHRCVIPASYYFEWEHFVSPDGKVKTGDKFMIQPSGSKVCWLAGLYRIEDYLGFSYPVFTVLTRDPGESIRFIHDRMPVILPENKITDWIRPDGHPKEVLSAALTDMVFSRC